LVEHCIWSNAVFGRTLYFTECCISPKGLATSATPVGVCTVEEVAVRDSADDEFRDFMRGRWPATVRLAYGLTGDLGHAEDVAQAAFARAYASWGRVTRTGDPDAYLRRIVVNENRRRFRKRRVAEELLGTLPDHEAAGHGASCQDGPDAVDSLDDRAALLTALGRLGPRQRAVVVLRFWMDMSEADTARALNCSVGTVKSQASRALAALRKNASVPGAACGDRGLISGDVIEGGQR
jgi:RNA polymerase sigma-70 factor (sigma-E family)